MRSAKARVARTLSLAVLLAAERASAQPSPATDATASAACERLAEAKRWFRQGNALREAGDYERALEFYQRSRALVASAPNTINAAFCLDRLGRYDEALEL